MFNLKSSATKAKGRDEELVSFTVSSVPEYLHSSAFYNSLNPDEDDEITLPRQHFKQDTNVKEIADAIHLLSTLRFWGSSEIPISLMSQFSLNSAADVQSIRDQFGDSFETVVFLCDMIQTGTNRVNLALERGFLEIVKLLIDQGETWDASTVCIHAAKSGRVQCLRYIHEKGGVLNHLVCKAAIEHNNIECLQYAIDNGVVITPQLNYLAASLGSLSAMQCMYRSHLTGTDYKWGVDTCRCAAENNHLACLKYAHENGAPWGTECTTGAAASGHLHILKYLHEQGCHWDFQAAINAAYHNNLDCLMFLHKHGCVLSITTAANAAFKGNFQCLRYLCENNCPLGTYAADMAAEKGHFDMVHYLFDHGCPLSETVYMWAAHFGNSEMMHFLLGQNVVMEDGKRRSAIEQASRHGHLACLQFVVEYRSPVLPATAPSSYAMLDGMANAAENGHLDCLTYLHDMYHQPHGAAGFIPIASWPTRICNKAAQNGHLECLKYAHEKGCPWEIATATYAAAAGKTHCLRYLIENNCPYYGIETLKWHVNRCNSEECKEYVRVLEDSLNAELSVAALQSVHNKRRFCWRRLFK